MLPLFNFFVGKLRHFAAMGADEVIVMIPVIELKNRLATIKLASGQNARLLELRQHPINGSQPNINLVIE